MTNQDHDSAVSEEAALPPDRPATQNASESDSHAQEIVEQFGNPPKGELPTRFIVTKMKIDGTSAQERCARLIERLKKISCSIQENCNRTIVEFPSIDNLDAGSQAYAIALVHTLADRRQVSGEYNLTQVKATGLEIVHSGILFGGALLRERPDGVWIFDTTDDGIQTSYEGQLWPRRYHELYHRASLRQQEVQTSVGQPNETLSEDDVSVAQKTMRSMPQLFANVPRVIGMLEPMSNLDPVLIQKAFDPYPTEKISELIGLMRRYAKIVGMLHYQLSKMYIKRIGISFLNKIRK